LKSYFRFFSKFSLQTNQLIVKWWLSMEKQKPTYYGRSRY